MALSRLWVELSLGQAGGQSGVMPRPPRVGPGGGPSATVAFQPAAHAPPPRWAAPLMGSACCRATGTWAEVAAEAVGPASWLTMARLRAPFWGGIEPEFLLQRVPGGRFLNTCASAEDGDKPRPLLWLQALMFSDRCIGQDASSNRVTLLHLGSTPLPTLCPHIGVSGVLNPPSTPSCFFCAPQSSQGGESIMPPTWGLQTKVGKKYRCVVSRESPSPSSAHSIRSARIFLLSLTQP